MMMKKRSLPTPIITITERNGFWIARTQGKEVKISSDACIMRDGIKQHPRLEATAEVAKLTNTGLFYTLFNY